MIVAIQQPEHLPWLGFFDKMTRVDRFVLLDNVQFKKRYFENRNRIRTAQGYRWITAPVKSKSRFTQRIDEVELEQDPRWKRKYWLAIHHAYSRAPAFRRYAERFERTLERDWTRLVELNVAFLQEIRTILELATPLELASTVVGAGGSGSQLILSICRALGASRYISGPDGARYLDRDSFTRHGIEVEFHAYRHPEYTQLHLPFIPQLSVIDLIFNHGEDALRILKS